MYFWLQDLHLWFTKLESDIIIYHNSTTYTNSYVISNLLLHVICMNVYISAPQLSQATSLI